MPPGPPQRAADTKDLQELNTYMRDRYNVIVSDSLMPHDFESVRNAVSEMDYLLSEFPQAVDTVKMIRGDIHKQQKSSTYAHASYSGEIVLNDKRYQDRAALLSQYRYDVSTHWHPDGTNGDHIVTHEMGHMLERALIEKAHPVYSFMGELAKGEEWRKGKQSSRLVSEACKLVKKTPAGKGMKNDQLIAQVSRYATKNRSETLAECVADYRANGANAKPLSVALWGLLKRELG